ncbi:MAG: FAD-dependent oxidoreductase [Enterocloster bolteae]
MTVKNVKTGELTRVDADPETTACSAYSASSDTTPRTELFEGKLEMDRGYIKTDEDMHTNVEGVYAVGDIR